MNIEKLIGVAAPVDEEAVEAELVAYISGLDVETAGEPWRIQNVGQADWALRKLIQAQTADREYADQIALWEDARKRAKHAADFFSDLLQAWGIASRTNDAKSFALAHGTVSTRQSAAKVSIVDKDAVIGWAETHAPDAIKVTKDVLVSLLTPSVKIVEWVSGYTTVDHDTGEIQRTMLMLPEPVAAIPEDSEPIMVEVVVDLDGQRVPGLSVTPAKITATVTPLGL